ncbi:MAG TPA: LamG-like jellyroll fold domain-containing protein, partial [Polyangiaceae bacterium]|nr:LamG-like jellyroll fold domain-containing protein [Polyangiaceae bacterium]
GGGGSGGSGNAAAGASAGKGGAPTNSEAGAAPSIEAAGAGGSSDNGGGAGAANEADEYDAAVLAERPVGFWHVDSAPDSEPDLSGHGHDGTYRGAGTPVPATLPNGASALAFDGAQQYLTIASSPAFSIPTTGSLTWEAWLRPDVLQFPNDDGSSGYVDWLGKCEEYGPTCEWEARMYSTETSESPNRPNRISAYVFNPSAGLGSAADWQPRAGLIQAGAWYHVVGQYTTLQQPADCDDADSAPGSIEIWVNGVKWDHGSHGQTGCMSQYDVVPKANGSAVNVATMAKESFFKGAIGKVAIYDHLLSQAQISHHYTLMTGKQPSGSCGNTCSF